MKKQKITLTIIFCAVVFTACPQPQEPECGPTTYRPEIGIGFVFQETDSGLVPVEGATVIVANRYWTPGMYGADLTVEDEFYITDAEGCYQVRFLEKKCYTFPAGNKRTIHCNTYLFYYEEKTPTASSITFGLNIDKIKNAAVGNIFLLDTIKIK